MQIKDLGEEAIREILAEAVDGMKRRTSKGWDLNLDGVTGDRHMRSGKDGRRYGTANVQPFMAPLRDGEPRVPEAIRFRSALRRRVLDATQAITPVPGAADIPAALARTFSAIATLDFDRASGDPVNPGVVHDLHRILDHLTGNDHSGCSTAPSVSDYGRVVPLGAKPKVVPIEADIVAVREALAEAGACCTDDCDIDGRAHVRELRETLDGLLAEQRRGA